MTVAELDEFYGISLEEPPAATLRDVLAGRMGDRLDVGSRLRLQGVDLVVRGMYEGAVDRVGLVIHATDVAAAQVTAARPAAGADAQGG